MNIVASMKDVKKYYGDGELTVKALDGISVDIETGKFVMIIGTSGSGKSTFLNILGGLDNPTTGKIVIREQTIAKMNDDELTKFRRKEIGFVFQNYNLVPVLSVYENIVLPVQLTGEMVDEGFVEEVLQILELQDKKNRLPEHLSGGQQQRVAIARALVSKPAIILADEPTGNLDSATSMQVMELLKKSAEKFHQTIVMITHNDTLIPYADQVFCMSDGVLSERRLEC